MNEMNALTSAEFDTLHRQHEDPWQMLGSRYEERKRNLLIAALPQLRYASAFEPGCSEGLLTVQLAPRCDRLLACDASRAALGVAAQRLQNSPQVRLEERWVPDQWPQETFDLIVLSEFLYYLPQPRIERLADQVAHSLRAQATVVACHWVRPIPRCSLNGVEVHQLLDERLGLHAMTRIRDADFHLDVWSTDPLSLAQSEAR